MSELTDCVEVSPSQHIHGTVLVVDDDFRNLGLVAAMLNIEGYRVLMACGPEEAVQVFEQGPAEIDLLLSDVRMPGVSGPELVTRLRKARPDLPVIFMTGYDRQALVPGNVLEKPFTMHDLYEKVAMALGGLAPRKMDRS
jgi:CheY-like chemotaxis protein